MSESFFVLEDHDDAQRTVTATDHTRGPWDPRAQHGGPPAALIGQTVLAHHARDDAQVVRLTVEIRRPVPITRLHVTTGVARPGHKVELLEAELHDDQGGHLLSARAWRIRTGELPVIPADDGSGVIHGPVVEGDPIPGPDAAEESTSFFREVRHTGYIQAIETRFVRGGWSAPGPSIAWLRMRYPLLDSEPTTPLARVLTAADSGNGISARFQGLFINPDLTVYLTRLPAGEWIGLDARTTLTNHGVGLATSVIHDVQGPLGRGSQSLLLDTAAED
ncbi:thioesterase family protein [Euzebya tangerina]|uniref:thioesterase family protein n=1 Tax=Euzebya tangerina TaxID=591198 RepID=UPI000E3117B5|nr:thioesterase family protein [Euzebya tangerina]